MVYPAPLLSSIVSAVGAAILLRQYIRSRRLFKLVFALQLLDMLVGQALEFYASASGWSVAAYKVYYFSSPLSAALLAIGVAVLLSWRKFAAGFTLYTLIVAVVLALRLSGATVDVTRLEELGPFVGGQAMPESVRVLSPILTIPSGLAIFALSIIGFRRFKAPEYAAIIAGNLVFMIAGGLLRRGYGEAFLWLELLATIILAYAFIVSRERKAAR